MDKNNIERKMRSVNPSKILEMELVSCRNLSVDQIAIALKITTEDVTHLLNGLNPISLDIAKNIASIYGGTAEHLIRLQASYDLEKVKNNLDSNSQHD